MVLASRSNRRGGSQPPATLDFSKHSVNGTRPVGVANLATRWHEVPLPPLEGNVVNLRIPFLSVKK